MSKYNGSQLLFRLRAETKESSVLELKNCGDFCRLRIRRLRVAKSSIGMRATIEFFLRCLLRSAVGCGAVFCTLGVATSSLQAKSTLIDDDDRMTVANYAKAHGMTVAQTEKLFAATGSVDCPTGEDGTANLVVKNDLIVVSAHGFYDEKGQLYRNPSSCRFITKTAGGIVSVPLSTVFLSGDYGSDRTRNLGVADWMVIQLKRAVPGVTPYSIPEIDPREIFEQGVHTYPVTVVAAYHKGWPAPGKEMKTVADCKIKGIVYRSGPRGHGWFESNCDSAGGASGGAYLYDLPGGQRIIVGILTAGIGGHYDTYRSFEFGKHFTEATMSYSPEIGQ